MPKAVITFVFKVLRNGLLRCKTRQLEHENTFCRFRVFAFPSFCAFPISVRLCLIASAIIDCNVFLLSARTAFLLCAFLPFSRFRAWRFRRFRVFAFSRFRVPPAASPRPGHRFRVHREHGLTIYYIYPWIWLIWDFEGLSFFCMEMSLLELAIAFKPWWTLNEKS